MKFEYSEHVPLEVGVVRALMCDREFQAEKAERLGARDFDMSLEQSDSMTVVRTQRQLPTAGLPEFVRALVRPHMVVTETERWEPSPADSPAHSGGFEIDVDGAPTSFRGRVDVVPEGSGARLTFSGTLTSTVPLFRSRVEESSASLVRETMRTECELLRERAVGAQAPSTP